MTYSTAIEHANQVEPGVFRASTTIRTRVMIWVIAIVAMTFFPVLTKAGDFNEPWRKSSKALVLDAYELNSLNWHEIVKNRRIVGFIGKASDGLTAEYCSDHSTLCGAKWRKYAITKELYHTRRHLAKALGLKWGAYHLGRADNPEQQALHFLQFAEPEEDEVIVLDIESMDTSKFMSLEDAERFSSYIYKKIGRFPMLYTNHNTATFIAANRRDYPLLSRLKLWYARYKSDVTGVFPLGNWDEPTLWQFAYGGNCNAKSCPYRVKGTPNDIDVNVSLQTVEQLRKNWPFDGLVEEKPFVEPSDPEMLLAKNTVEYPEEEKHSDFVADQDYFEPNLSSLSVAAIEPTGSPRKIIQCDATMDKLDSDALAEC